MMRRECAVGRKAADWTLLREFELRFLGASVGISGHPVIHRPSTPKSHRAVPAELTLEAAKMLIEDVLHIKGYDVVKVRA